jgi:hypothetical protein
MKNRILQIIIIIANLLSLQLLSLNAQSNKKLVSPIINSDSNKNYVTIRVLGRSSDSGINKDTMHIIRYHLGNIDDTIKFATVESYSTESDVYDYVDVNPSYYISDIQKKIIYSKETKVNFNGILYLKVLIGTDGIPIKYVVEYTDSKMMVNTIVNAVMGTKFTPAIKDGKSVKVWVSIPIKFSNK